MEVELPGHKGNCVNLPECAPEDTATYLSSRLDEVHAAVLAAKRRPPAARNPAGLIEVGDSETFAELADLAKAWIHWLVEAARDGDSAARAHLRELGFDGPLTRADGFADEEDDPQWA
jgi:hypothetical protein